MSSAVTPERLGQRIIAIASDFIGLVEVKSNAHWDDPDTPYPDSLKDAWLRKWMGMVSGWEPGAAYCVAFDGACIANAMKQLGLNYEKFLSRWTAGVMNNVEMLRERGLVHPEPVIGGIYLARHGHTWQGHAGIVTGIHGDTISTIEGNTSADPSAGPAKQREGDGIWPRTFNPEDRGDLILQTYCTPSALLQLAQ